MGMMNNRLSYWQAETERTRLLELTMGDLLDQRADENPLHEAIVYSCYPEFGDTLSIRWTYQDYRNRANAIAKGLLALGLKQGDHIAILAANVPDWPFLLMAAAKTGLVLVTINPLLRAAEIEYILKQGDVRALFFMARVRDYDHLATIRALTIPCSKHGDVTSERFPLLRHVSLLGMPPTGLIKEAWRPTFLSEVVTAGAQLSDTAVTERQASVSPTDPAVLIYTSGTTGFPKGALLMHYGLVNNALVYTKRLEPFVQREGLTLQDLRVCSWFPFFHVAGIVTGLLSPLYAGSTTYPLLAFDPIKAMQIISRERCLVAIGVSTMIQALLAHPDVAHFDLSSLKMVGSGGAPVPLFLVEQIKTQLGADVGICFGQTEGSCCITMTLADDPFELKAATVGKALPHIEIKLIDPATGEIVPAGELGELCYRGVVVMAGYYKMPEKTAETIDPDGWAHSGDLATMSAQGYLNIVGRLKDMVIRGGENLFPVEVEEFLIRHPKVAQVQVVGVPDAYFGEELLAVVMKRAGEQLTGEELRVYCQGKISHQKIPRYFQFVENYPLTASGKVQKFVLREQAIKALGLEEVGKIKTA
jgi:fatty-acyl-CoA synthase